MKATQIDRHLVAHDAFSLVFAGACGAAGTVIGQSLAMGVVMMAAVFTLGVFVMRTAPLRRTVNRLALAAYRAAGSAVGK